MREINESFIDHKEFDNWCHTQNQENVFKIKIDNNSPEYFSIIIYPKEHFKEWNTDLILLAPLEITSCENNYYDIWYPQIGPIDWKTLEVLEEYSEEELLPILTDNPNAKVWLGDCEEKEN